VAADTGKAPRLGVKCDDVIVDTGMTPNHHEIVDRGGFDSGGIKVPIVRGNSNSVVGCDYQLAVKCLEEEVGVVVELIEQDLVAATGVV
jgi:hypothetical protein